MEGPPYNDTHQKPNKTFSMVRKDIALAKDVVNLNLSIWDEARAGHTVNGVKHNLLSMAKIVRARYIPIFQKDVVNFYGAHNMEIPVLRAVLLRGHYGPKVKLWRIPLLPKHVSKQ